MRQETVDGLHRSYTDAERLRAAYDKVDEVEERVHCINTDEEVREIRECLRNSKMFMGDINVRRLDDSWPNPNSDSDSDDDTDQWPQKILTAGWLMYGPVMISTSESTVGLAVGSVFAILGLVLLYYV